MSGTVLEATEPNMTRHYLDIVCPWVTNVQMQNNKKRITLMELYP